MVIMRLTFLTLALTALCFGAHADDDRPDLTPPSNTNESVFGLQGFDTTEIGDGLYTFRWEGTRNIFMVTDEGVIVTDPISVSAAKALRGEIAKITDKPVKYVVYSHTHWDHILGGGIFKEEGAQFVAHENCVDDFYRNPHPDLVMPDITFPDDYTVTLGGRSLELLYFGPNHSDCLVVMRPDSPNNYLFIVDLVTPGAVPLGRLPDQYLLGYIDSLRAIEKIPGIDKMIPGHRMVEASIDAVTERRAYMEALMLAVKNELAAGTPRGEILDKITLSEFSGMRNFDTQMRENVRRVLSYYALGW